MRLQLADGGRRRRSRNFLQDGEEAFSKIFEGLKKAAQNPDLQKAAGNIIGQAVKKKQAVTGNSGIGGIINQASGVNQLQADVLRLTSENTSLKSQRYGYGIAGVAFGLGVGYLLSSKRNG